MGLRDDPLCPCRLTELIILLSLPLLAAACAGSLGGDASPSAEVRIEGLEPADLGTGEALRVVATTTLVGDVVARVGGEGVELTVLLPVGADPHAYSPTPQDMRQVQDAHVVFINGLGLEEALLGELTTAAPDTPVVSLSEGIEPRRQAGAEGDHPVAEAETEPDPSSQAHPSAVDPHVWFDPRNVQIWARNAADALAALDPNRTDEVQARARSYSGALEELDSWIQDQVSSIPEANRELVTDHLMFGYFSEHYGFEMIGAVIPAYSSLAEPSARSLAELERLVAEREVKAVFVGIGANPALAERISEDLGVRLVPLYVGSLSEPGGPAGTYLEFMRFDVGRIVEALS